MDGISWDGAGTDAVLNIYNESSRRKSLDMLQVWQVTDWGGE